MSELKLLQCRVDGRYDIEECLSRGSYAEIYVARDRAATPGHLARAGREIDLGKRSRSAARGLVERRTPVRRDRREQSAGSRYRARTSDFGKWLLRH